MGFLDWLKTLRREREQLTVELAEEGVAPDPERRNVEKQIEAETERHGEHTPPEGGSS
jgi:hypothetical protein